MTESHEWCGRCMNTGYVLVGVVIKACHCPKGAERKIVQLAR